MQQAFTIPVTLWDERLTTAQAERTLIQAGLRRARRRQVIDSVAALLILQNYLDRRGREQRG
jgi:putative Holliday junction resolvase